MISILGIVSVSIIPLIITLILIHGYINDVDLYDCFIEGAKEGFKTAIRIMPYLIAIFLAIGIFKRSGAMDLIISMINPLTKLLAIPKDILPLVIMKPISGSGSLAIVKEILQTFGPDSFLGRVASTMMGSAETIFYTMAIYFGAIGIKNSRHTLLAALISHIAAVFASIFICGLVFGYL